MAPGTWTCQHQTGGVKCRAVNPKRKHICESCGKRRPKSSRAAHLSVLDLPYEWWVEQFGEQCGICGAKPKPGERLYKEHEHVGDGIARGLACFQCNRKLGNKKLAWMRMATAYLERAEARKETDVQRQPVQDRQV